MVEMNLVKSRKTVASFVIVFAIASYQVSVWEPAANSSFFHRVFSEVFGPAQSATTSFKQNIKDIYNYYFDLVDSAKENELLKQEILTLRRRIREYDEVVLENQRLKSLLSYEQSQDLNKVFAKVIAWDNFKDFRVIRIDRGKNSGVNLRDAVVTNEGLVGSIYSVSQNYSEVILVNDVNSRVDILNSRTRARGIVEGYNESQLLLKYSELKEDYQRGDTLITAGLSYLPKGIAVAKVSKIQDSAWLSKKKIFLEPAVDLAALEDVMVLVKKKEDFDLRNYLEKK